jgi:hypothetical protein
MQILPVSLHTARLLHPYKLFDMARSILFHQPDLSSLAHLSSPIDALVSCINTKTLSNRMHTQSSYLFVSLPFRVSVFVPCL